MSSLQENSTLPLDAADKRKGNFSRSDSFDKLHYTAFYTIQLAGTLLSQKSMMQILDLIQYKSRTILYSMPILKMVCTVFLHWIDSFADYFGFNAIHEKKISSTKAESNGTYASRLKILREATTKNSNQIEQQTNKQNPMNQLKIIDDINVITPRTAIVNKLKSRSDSEESISNRHHIGFVVIVYGSATLVYIQLMFLAVFLQTAATPPGLVFLVTSLGFIGYIVFKMCFVKSKAKDDGNASKSPKISSSTQTSIETSTIDDVTSLKRSQRFGRSYTRRFLYFHNKTLSKIKLL